MKKIFRREPAFYRRLWVLSLPVILQNLITFSLGLIDTLMVSQLGNREMAAVTAANVPVFLLISVVFGIQNGLGILASQYWGKQDLTSINRAMSVACVLGAGLSVVMAAVLFCFPVQVMDLLSNEHTLSVLGAPYLRWIGISYVFNMLSSIYVSVQRSVENTSFGMKLFGFSTILNTILNYLLIFGSFGFPRMEVEGAALATLLSRVAEFLICLFCALRSRNVPLDAAALLRPGLEMFRKVVKYSTPVVINEAMWGLGTSMITVIFGYTANSVDLLAANAVVGNLHRLFLVACFGFGAATSVIIGKAIGEGQRREEILDLSDSVLTFTVFVGALLAIISLLLIPTLFVPVVFPLFKLFGDTAHIAVVLSVACFSSIPLNAFSISAITGVLRSGGDVFWATMYDLAPQWLLAIPLTAITALTLQTSVWFIAFSIQLENYAKVPLCRRYIKTGKWIHDVTKSPSEQEDRS